MLPQKFRHRSPNNHRAHRAQNPLVVHHPWSEFVQNHRHPSLQFVLSLQSKIILLTNTQQHLKRHGVHHIITANFRAILSKRKTRSHTVFLRRSRFQIPQPLNNVKALCQTLTLQQSTPFPKLNSRIFLLSIHSDKCLTYFTMISNS